MHEPEFDAKEMIYFDPNHEGAIVEDLARGMSMSEVCEFFGCNIKEIDEEDKKFLHHFYKKGRAVGQRQAVHALFDQMKQRGGGQVALSYLTRFAEEWPEEGVAANANGFNFKVIMGDK